MTKRNEKRTMPNPKRAAVEAAPCQPSADASKTHAQRAHDDVTNNNHESSSGCSSRSKLDQSDRTVAENRNSSPPPAPSPPRDKPTGGSRRTGQETDQSRAAITGREQEHGQTVERRADAPSSAPKVASESSSDSATSDMSAKPARGGDPEPQSQDATDKAQDAPPAQGQVEQTQQQQQQQQQQKQQQEQKQNAQLVEHRRALRTDSGARAQVQEDAASQEEGSRRGEEEEQQAQGRAEAGNKTNNTGADQAGHSQTNLASSSSPLQPGDDQTCQTSKRIASQSNDNNNQDHHQHHILELNNNISYNNNDSEQPAAESQTITISPFTVIPNHKVPADSSNNLLDNNNNSHSQHHHHLSHHHHHHHHPNKTPFKTHEHTSTKRLSYLQALLLRKWPCLALTICIMSSLLFGILLSALTVYLMHGFTNCSAEYAHLAGQYRSGGVGHHNEHLHAHHSAANLLPSEQQLLASNPSAAAGGSSSPKETPLESGGGGGGDQLAEPPIRRVGLAAPDAPDDKQLVAVAKTSAPQGAASSGSGESNAPSQAFQRLPSSLVPQHYNLFVWPHLSEPSFHFNGTVEIRLTCVSPASNITLHTLELELSEKSITLSKLAPSSPISNGTETSRRRKRRQSAASASPAPKVIKLSQDKQLQYSIIQLDAPLEAGQDYLLRIDYVGSLNDDLAGFYKIKYERQNSSETTWIAATQFQATDARRAFPCFDEPLYKATFSIKIKHWSNMTALSNMPIVSSEKSQDGLWITDTFAKSHRMSTYLVAFAVTNFESRTDGNITVWTRPGFVHTAEYALKIAGSILRHYEDFFGIAYPLPKMDMIALPDFNAGAMENWGLITYRETAMLYDANSSSVGNKQRVAVVVAHELAHQWFGNLVTPKWWDDLWLNEGFASYVEYIGVNHVEPEWRMLDQFVVEEVQNVLKLDALSSSHQISIPVNNPDEISEIFDHISYAKGASVIRMMLHFLTEPVFKLGLQRYLSALRYNNAEQSDLWSHLMAAQRSLAKTNSSTRDVSDFSSSLDVGRIMNSWTLQTGYPLVTLTRNYSNAGSAQLEQVRYQPYKIQQDQMDSSSGGGNKTSAVAAAAAAAVPEQRWEIPITYTWKSDQNWSPMTRLWMHQNDSSPVQISAGRVPPSDEWMILNVQQVGYYRVNYDLQNWRLLIAQLQANHSLIGTTNRAQILDDIFELAKSSHIDYALAMESTKYLKLERDYLPWESVLLSFGYIDEMLQRTPIYGDWQDYFSQLIEPYYSRYRDLDWTKKPTGQSSQLTVQPTANTNTTNTIDANDVLEQYNQVNAVSWACQVNNRHCVSKAKRVFSEWRETGVNNIQPALRYASYCAAIEFGTKDDWDFLWGVYEREQGATERDRILRALGCSKEMWILSRYLDWTFNKSKGIRRQDGSFVFRMIAKNNYGRDLAFNFMRERWAIIKEYYGKSSFSLGHLIKSVATSMNTQVELDQLKAFYETIKGDIGTGKRSFQIAIEEVESNVFWKNRNYKILEDWLQKERPDAHRAPKAKPL